MASDRYNKLVYGGDDKAQNDAAVGDGLTLGLGGFGARNERHAAVDTIAGVPELELNNDRYQTPGYAGDFDPTQYKSPEAASYQTVNEDPRTRAMQMQALGRMQQFGDQAANSQESLGRQQALQDANAVAAQREAGVRNQMQMRGQGGSATEFAMAQQGGQEAANRAQMGTMNAAAQAALQRLQGTQAAYGAASGIRGQDYNTAAGNADIINRFNMHNTDARNATNNANTGMMNEAGLGNIQRRQVSNNAVSGTANANVDRDNNNRQAIYNSRFGQATATSNALTGAANGGQAADGANRRDAWGMLKDVAKLSAGA